MYVYSFADIFFEKIHKPNIENSLKLKRVVLLRQKNYWKNII